MANESEFELDEETLKKIEEEALREVEAEFELDEKTLLEIEAAAKREAGLEGVDLGDDFLEELRTEAKNISDDDLDFDNFDLDLDLDDFDLDIDSTVDAGTAQPKADEPLLDLGPEPDLTVSAAPEPNMTVSAAHEPNMTGREIKDQAIRDRDAKAFPNFDGSASAPKIAMPTPSASSAIAPPPPPPKISSQLNIQAPLPPPRPPSPRPAAPQMGGIDQDNGYGTVQEAAVEEARTQAIQRARRQAKRKAVAKAAKAARVQVSNRSALNPNATDMERLERHVGHKSNTVMIAAILAGVIILGGLCAMVGIVMYHRSEANEPPPKPITVHTDSHGNPIKASEVEAVNIYNQIVKVNRRTATLESVEKALEQVNVLRSQYPDYAAKKAKPLEQKETKLKEWRKAFKEFGM